MRTRGKTKVETTDYSKDGMDPRDLLDDGENTNGYADDKIEDIAPGRNDSRNVRSTGNRRPGRLPKAGAAKNRNDKLMESAEFREVVQGFFDFIEEINRSRKKTSKKPGKAKNGETRPYKLEEPDPQKKLKTEMLKPLPNDKPEIQSPSPSETSKLYKFKEDANTGKGLMDLIKDKEQNVHPSSYVQAGGQDAKGHFTEQARKEAQINKPGFQGNMMDFGPFDPNSLKYANLQELNNNIMFNKNKAVPPANPYEYNSNMFKDIMQRMQMQSYGEQQNPMRNYGMPFYDGYHKMGLESFGVKPSAAEMMNLQMIEALLQKNQPNILGSLFGNSPALFGDLPREFPYNMVNNLSAHQRFGNQSLGVELIQSDPEAAINPKVYEGKLGRASTHVAIAYFIHFKSLDPDTIAKSDKSKVDPTYNARMLKEKKYETFPGEQSIASKLLPQGFENRFGNLGGLGNLPLEYLGAQDLQKLIAQQGLTDHQLREMQIQRIQQEALRDEFARRNMVNKSNEIKLEEERAEQQRRHIERANRPPNKPSVIKEDEIIEIKENSDAEVEEVKEEVPQEKVEVKDEVKSEADKRSSNAMQIEGENGGPISAEDIVEEITELTSSSNYDPKKGGKRGKTSLLTKPVTVKKHSEEAARSDASAHKANAMVEEIENPGQNGSEEKGEVKEGIQVISDDEEASKMQIEPAPEEQIEEESAANPPQ